MALEISADIPAHDASLVGDQLTTLVVNYRWRRILTPLIETLCDDSFWTGTPAEIEDATYKAINLLFDLYDIDPMQKIAAKLFGTSPGLIPASTNTVVVWKDPATDARAYDYGGFWSSSDPTTIIIPPGAGGIYTIHATAFFMAAPLGQRVMQVLKNGSEWVAQVYDATDNWLSHGPGVDIEVEAGDTFKMMLWSSTPVSVVQPIWFTLHRVFK